MTAAEWRSSSAGRGCTCGPSPAGSRPTCSRPTPRSGPGSRRSSWTSASSRSSSVSGWPLPTALPRSTCATRGASCGRSRWSPSTADGLCRSPAGTADGSRGSASSSTGPPTSPGSRPAPRPSSTPASSRRPAPSASASTRPSRRSPRSAIARRGRFSTAASSGRRRSPRMPVATPPSRSASGPGSGSSRPSPGSTPLPAAPRGGPGRRPRPRERLLTAAPPRWRVATIGHPALSTMRRRT